jgi:hypothetical protein
MTHVFVVVATRDSEVEVCEAFSGLAALGRAFQLASDKSGRGRTDLFNHSPNEEVLPDGSTRWVFMDTNKQSVVVFYRQVEEALLDSKDPRNVIGGLSTSKDISKDMVPSGSVSLQAFSSKKPIEDDFPLVYPPRGTLHIDDGYHMLWDDSNKQWQPGTVTPAQRPIHDLPPSINPRDDFEWIDAIEYIKDGLPYGAGGNLAKAILDMDLSPEDWGRLVVDITKLPTELVISSFFNAFLQMISDHDQNLLDLAKETGWYANFDFQYDNILRWMEEFKPLPPPFDFLDRTLPAGWDINNKPIAMGALLDNPGFVKDHLLDLSDAEKWALVTARIRKSPHFAVTPKGYSGYIPSRNDALKAVEDRSDLGTKVRDADLEKLHELRKELMAGTLKSL